MAPLPHNNTAIYYLDYTVGGLSHTLENRVEGTVSDADASGAFEDFLSAMTGELFVLTVDGMRYSAAGSHVSSPAVYTGATTFGDTTPTDISKAQFFSFVGRSPDGRRVKATLFGVKGAHAGNDFRVPVSSQTSFTAARSVLTADAGQFLTISASQPTWKTYVNFGWNAYWQRQLRTN